MNRNRQFLVGIVLLSLISLPIAYAQTTSIENFSDNVVVVSSSTTNSEDTSDHMKSTQSSNEQSDQNKNPNSPQQKEGTLSISELVSLDTIRGWQPPTIFIIIIVIVIIIYISKRNRERD